MHDPIATWHALGAQEAVRLLETDSERGLQTLQAAQRLARVGPNRVADGSVRPLWKIALAQFRSVVVLLLLAASLVAFALGDGLEALAILAALLLNAGIGFTSEWRARVSLDRLRALAVPKAAVRRDGRTFTVAAAELVPGDLLVLSAGSHVAADARLLRAAALVASEAALTGESVPVVKESAGAGLPAGTPLAERTNMVYLGTTIVAGSGLAVVCATGTATELGRIGQLVATAGERTTPLELQVERLGRRLMLVALVVCALVGAAGVLRGQAVGLMMETAISLAVAAIPEGLPAVTTLALAAGLWRLAKAGALVRRLPAVETLGSTTVICFDKTGTVTVNRMTAVRLWAAERLVEIPARGSLPDDPAIRLLLEAGCLVNDAVIEPAGPSGGIKEQGDPTETALLVAATKAGLDPAAARRLRGRLAEIPFDPAHRYMATLHEKAPGALLLVKGAPEVLLERCSRLLGRTGERILTLSDRQEVSSANEAMARDGLRVLALARRDVAPAETAAGAFPALSGLTLQGLVGITDPLRDGVRPAVEECRAAGIRPVMLTGDQRATAEAVGRQLGLSDSEVRGRFSPEQKMALIRQLQGQGEIVAMTGDGVNDAPALARADIGVAMGRQGTDVAREAADLVLTDDNFATIVRAVKEGRVIHDNLRKVIHFLFSCNVSEILLLLVAILAGCPAPLLPLQILWVNLITDILPALALIRDPADPEVMRRPARDPKEAIVTWRFGGLMLLEGAVLAAGVLGAFAWSLSRGASATQAGTLAFVAIVLVHPLQAMNCRSTSAGWWRLPPNRLVWLSLAALAAAQCLATSWSPLAQLLRTQPLTRIEWTAAALSVVWPVALLETVKRRRARAAGSAG